MEEGMVTCWAYSHLLQAEDSFMSGRRQNVRALWNMY